MCPTNLRIGSDRLERWVLRLRLWKGREEGLGLVRGEHRIVVAVVGAREHMDRMEQMKAAGLIDMIQAVEPEADRNQEEGLVEGKRMHHRALVRVADQMVELRSHKLKELLVVHKMKVLHMVLRQEEVRSVEVDRWEVAHVHTHADGLKAVHVHVVVHEEAVVVVLHVSPQSFSDQSSFLHSISH